MNVSHIFHHYLDPSVYETDSCPGRFCGRVSNTTECGTCPWGFRAPSSDSDKLNSLCEPCESPLSLHDWLYLGFIFLLPILFFFVVLPLVTQIPSPNNTDIKHRRSKNNLNLSCNSPKSSLNNTTVTSPSTSIPTSKCTSLCTCSTHDRKIWILGLLCIVIHTLAATATVFLFPPFGHFTLIHCPIYRLDDFYAPLLAAPGCSYEAVFPLTSLPLVYFGFSAIQSLFCYSFLFLFVFANRSWFNVLYYALYAYPILCVLITIFGGLLYYIYTYFLLILALIDSLYRFPLVFDYCSKSADLNLRPVCHPLIPLKAMLQNPGRFTLPVLLNVICISYAILAHLQTFSWVVLLSLGPFLFYLLTLPLSHPLVYYNGDEILNNMRHQDHSRPTSNAPTSQVQFRIC